MSSGRAEPPGYPEGIQQKILAGDLDEDAKAGSRTRLLRFDPSIYTTQPFVHDYWEEVYLSQVILLSAMTRMAREVRHSCRTPMRAARQGPFMGRSSRMKAVYCSKFTTTTQREPSLKNDACVVISMSAPKYPRRNHRRGTHIC